jgi:hypothetical protein
MAISSVSKDFIVKHGLVVNTTATFLSTAPTDSPYTGALTVAGGVGVGGDLQVAGTIYGNLVGTATAVRSVITQATSTNELYYPVFVTDNVDTAFAFSEYTTGSFKINPGTGVVEMPHILSGYGEFSTATISVPLNTSSPETGALVVVGGVGIGSDLHVGGKIFTDGITSSGTVTLSGIGISEPRYSVKIDSGGPGAKLAIRTSANPSYGILQAVLNDSETGGAISKFGASEFHFFILDETTGDIVQQDAIAITTSGQVLLTGLTSATSTSTGALVVSGGVGIGGDLYVGGNFYSGGVPVLTTNTIAESFTGGVDISVDISTSTGILTINDVSTLETVTARGATTSSTIYASIIYSDETRVLTTASVIAQPGLGIGTAVDVEANTVAIGILPGIQGVSIDWGSVTETLDPIRFDFGTF